MKNNRNTSLMSLALISLLGLSGCGSDDYATDATVNKHIEDTTHKVADEGHATQTHTVSDEVIEEQRAALAFSIIGKDVGAQSPRDIDSVIGSNTKATTTAPLYTAMNLCDIHFHKSAEHKGGEFTTYAGNGDGEGYGSGYKYSGHLTASETEDFHNDGSEVFTNAHNSLHSGDTIEVHYVYTSNAGKSLGHSLGTCLIGENPLLRVETQVYVVVNDNTAADFMYLTAVSGDGTAGHLYQAANIPNDTGTAVEYEGSTTGPSYNEKVSPYQVTWNVRPKITKVNIESVGTWCHHNQFDEDHAHAVRNLVKNADLLSAIH